MSEKVRKNTVGKSEGKKVRQRAGAEYSAGHQNTEKVYKLRLTDPESSRVVAVLGKDGKPQGAGCLVDSQHILTCSHLIATGEEIIRVRLVGITQQPEVEAKVVTPRNDKDIALLEIQGDLRLDVAPVVYASPIRHGGKSFSVLGFPKQDDFGSSAKGSLFPADAIGAIQMDSEGNILVEGGFSGAPVWCDELRAYVGMVSMHRSASGVAWCISSRDLCEVIPELQVRYRVCPADRPVINDRELDDPNAEIYGTQTKDEKYELSARVVDKKSYFEATVAVRRLDGKIPPGRHVTFVTYPDLERDGEDAYELFARFDGKSDKAEVSFYPEESFTVAAVLEGGARWLTFDLAKSRPRASSFK